MEHREYIALKIEQCHLKNMEEEYIASSSSSFKNVTTLKSWAAKKSDYNQHIAPLFYEAIMVFLNYKEHTVADLGSYLNIHDVRIYVKRILSLNLVLPLSLLSLSKEETLIHVDNVFFEVFSKMMDEDFRLDKAIIDQDKFADEHFKPSYSDTLFLRYVRQQITCPQEPIEILTETQKKSTTRGRPKNAK